MVATQLSLENQRIIEGLETVNHAFIEHGVHPDIVDAAIVAYAQFTDELPDPSLEALENMIPNTSELDDIERHLNPLPWNKYHTNYPEFAKPGGYTNRSLQVAALRQAGRKVYDPATGEFKEPADDPKEFYHFHPNSTVQMSRIHKALGWGALPPEVHDLHAALMPIHKAGVQVITRVYQAMEDTHPELISKHFGPQDVMSSPLRLVAYHHGQGKVLAAPHTDKAKFTAQIGESHVGLWLNDPRTGLVHRHSSLATVFAGKALHNENAYPGSAIAPGEHGVKDYPELNTDRKLHGKNIARWAIIFFANSIAAGTIDNKADTHI